MSFKKRAEMLIGSIPAGSVTTYVAIATAAGDRNQFHPVAKLVREHPDQSHRILCAGKQSGEFFVSPKFRVPEGGFLVAVKRLRAEGIDVNDGGLLRDSSTVLDADDLRRPLSPPEEQPA